jgi:hypothetical protein
MRYIRSLLIRLILAIPLVLGGIHPAIIQATENTTVTSTTELPADAYYVTTTPREGGGFVDIYHSPSQDLDFQLIWGT